MLNFFLTVLDPNKNFNSEFVNEQLQMYGVEVHYLPRQYATTKLSLKRSSNLSFTGFPLGAYIDNYEGYTGQGTILFKIWNENRDDLQLVISKRDLKTISHH